jgi:hypothetical protein
MPYLLNRPVLQVRDAHRSKMLAPSGLPCGVATVDGKNLATLDHDADGTGHSRSKDNEKWHKKKTNGSDEGGPSMVDASSSGDVDLG